MIKTIRSQRQTGDPTLNDLRWLRDSQDGELSYKLSFHEGSVSLANPPGQKLASLPPSVLCVSQLKINKSKFEDLKKLKAETLSNFHPFQDSLQN